MKASLLIPDVHVDRVHAQDRIGTLESGKLADMVLIDGNPLTNLSDLLEVVLTIKDGRIVSDRRSARTADRK